MPWLEEGQPLIEIGQLQENRAVRILQRCRELEGYVLGRGLREVAHDDVDLGEVVVIGGDHNQGPPAGGARLFSLVTPLAVEPDHEIVPDAEHYH